MRNCFFREEDPLPLLSLLMERKRDDDDGDLMLRDRDDDSLSLERPERPLPLLQLVCPALTELSIMENIFWRGLRLDIALDILILDDIFWTSTCSKQMEWNVGRATPHASIS